MNENESRIDDELIRFEQDLKSLTPLPFSATTSALAKPFNQDNQLPSQFDTINTSVVIASKSSSLPVTHGIWLKTVTVSWVTGLAAGLLVSAMWTKLMIEETSTTELSPLAENRFSAGVSEPNTPLYLSTNSTSSTPSSQQSVVTQSLATQSLIVQRWPGFVGNMWRASHHSPDQMILYPFMSLSKIGWNAAIQPTSKRLTGVLSETKQESEQANTPNYELGESQLSIPVSIPKTRGQRELLKSLLESDDLISI